MVEKLMLKAISHIQTLPTIPWFSPVPFCLPQYNSNRQHSTTSSSTVHSGRECLGLVGSFREC